MSMIARMKYSITFAAVVLLLGAIRSQAEEVLPPHFNFERYTKMVDHSPFAVATSVAAPAATPDFAKDLYIANAARSPDGDMVTLASTSDHNFKKYLTTRCAARIAAVDSDWQRRASAPFARDDSAQPKNVTGAIPGSSTGAGTACEKLEAKD